MKKTIALIFRFLIMIFSIWGIFQKLGFYILSISPQILDFTFLNSILIFICYLMLFVVGISKKPNRNLLYFKSVLTLSSVTVFLINSGYDYSLMSFDWILGILTPALVVFDWAVFERKIHFDFKDCFIRYGIFISIILVLALIHLFLFKTGNVFYVMGFRDNVIGFMGLMIISFFATFLMYLYDVIKSSLKRKKTKNTASLIYKAIMLVINLLSVFLFSSFDFGKIITDFKYFHIILALLWSFLLIFEMIYGVIKKKAAQLRIVVKLKGSLLMSELLLLISYLVFKNKLISHGITDVMFYIIIPLLFIIGWILFDKKGNTEVLDPLIWTLLPFGYFCVVTSFIKDYVSIYPTVFSLSQPEMFIGYFSGMILIGYLMCFADKIAYKLRK